MASSKFDYRFITQPKDTLDCHICLRVVRGQPKQHGGTGGCGDLFCKECIEKYGDQPCPSCGGEEPVYYGDVRSKFKPNSK